MRVISLRTGCFTDVNLCLISLTNENINVFQDIGKKIDALAKQKDCEDAGF